MTRIINDGGKEGISDSEKWDDLEENSQKQKDFDRHFNKLKNTDPFELLDLAYKIGGAVSNPSELKDSIIKKMNVKQSEETFERKDIDEKLDEIKPEL